VLLQSMMFRARQVEAKGKAFWICSTFSAGIATAGQMMALYLPFESSYDVLTDMYSFVD